jgi:tetratricopeptide (TPR) repeat protein
VARYLEGQPGANPALIAQHYLEGGSELSAAGYLLKAAAQAQLGSLGREARDLAERAVAIYQRHRDPREYEAVAQFFDILGWHGTFEELGEASSRLIRLARDPGEKTRAMANRAELLHLTRRFEEALAQVDEALLAAEPADLRVQAMLRQIELYCCIRLGYYERAKAALVAYKALSERLEDLEVRGAVIEDEGVLWAALDEHRQAIGCFDQTLAMIDQHEQFDFAKARLLSRKAHSELALGLGEAALEHAAQAKETAARYAVTARGFVWPCMAEATALLALGRLPEAWAAAQEAERWDREEDPKVTYQVLAEVLWALGQTGQAEAELRAFFAQGDADVSTRVSALILLGQITQTPAPLGEAATHLARLPKPELHARLRLAQAQLAAPQEALLRSAEALKIAGPLELKPLEATALARKAQALLKLGRPQEARAAIGCALEHPASLLSPAEVRFTAFQILEDLGEAGAKTHLEAAQDWVHQTALGLPKDLRADFLQQPLHRQIL